MTKWIDRPGVPRRQLTLGDLELHVRRWDDGTVVRDVTLSFREPSLTRAESIDVAQRDALLFARERLTRVVADVNEALGDPPKPLLVIPDTEEWRERFNKWARSRVDELTFDDLLRAELAAGRGPAPSGTPPEASGNAGPRRTATDEGESP